MTASEFLAWEREQVDKHELHDGEVLAMAGGSVRHNALAAAIVGELRAALRGTGCVVLTSDQRIAPRRKQRYVYPDVSVVCGARELEEGTNDVLANPGVVVEVLSKSTERRERGEKWEGYRRIPSLTDYVLVSQSRTLLEQFQRQKDGSWRYAVAEAGEKLSLANGAVLGVDAIYDGVMALEGDDG